MITGVEVTTEYLNFVSIKVWDKFLGTITDK